MRRAGIAVVWDTDDDIGAVTRGSEAWHRLGGRRDDQAPLQAGASQSARRAHLVTTTNEHLAQIYRDAAASASSRSRTTSRPEDCGTRADATRES